MEYQMMNFNVKQMYRVKQAYCNRGYISFFMKGRFLLKISTKQIQLTLHRLNRLGPSNTRIVRLMQNLSWEVYMACFA